MEGPPDWDLLAVVRSCSSTTTTATTTAPPAADPHTPPPQLPPPPPQRQQQQQQQLCFSPTTSACTSSSSVLFGFSTALSNTSTSFYSDLQDICKPLICSLNSSASSSAALTPPISSSSLSLSQFRHVVKPSHVVFGGSSTALSNTSTSSSTTSHSQRAKKRKNLMKKVCHVPAEGLSSDMWAWRKYGQKPIKGSPYPRGYYRCSSSKGCLARKQVERNRTDPKMFIVTYTSEHNHPMPTHRNSLAGSTRQKTTTTPPEHPPCSSPSATTAATTLSPLTEPSESKTEGDDMMMTKDDEYDDDDMRELSDLMLSDDFYVGFEQIDGGSDDSDCFSEQFSPSSSEFPWLSNGGSTATAAGGT